MSDNRHASVANDAVREIERLRAELKHVYELRTTETHEDQEMVEWLERGRDEARLRAHEWEGKHELMQASRDALWDDRNKADEELRQLRALLARCRAWFWCPSCGQYRWEHACGPTHALMFTELPTLLAALDAALKEPS